MKIINDKTCSWINDLDKRTNMKVLHSYLYCDWVILGAGFRGLSAARKLAELHPEKEIILADAQLAEKVQAVETLAI